jgi:hypothetical protein
MGNRFQHDYKRCKLDLSAGDLYCDRNDDRDRYNDEHPNGDSAPHDDSDRNHNSDQDTDCH